MLPAVPETVSEEADDFVESVTSEDGRLATIIAVLGVTS